MDYDAVADAVERRMRELGMTKTTLARAADVDRATIAKLLSRTAWTIRPANLGKIERALDWPVGTIERLGDHRPPADQPLDLDAIVDRLDTIAREVNDLRALLRPRAHR